MEYCGEHMDFNIKVCLVCLSLSSSTTSAEGCNEGISQLTQVSRIFITGGGSTTCSTLYLENLYRSTKLQTQ